MKKGMQGPVPTPEKFAPGDYAEASNPSAASGARVTTGAESFPGTDAKQGANQMNDTRGPVSVGKAQTVEEREAKR